MGESPTMSSHTRLTRWQKATALVPLALLSGAWTTSLTLTSSASAESTQQQAGRLPDGTSIPDQAITAPASVSSPGEIAPGVPTGSAQRVVKGASANGIPAAALSAYQRAAQVIDSADKGCHIDWTLIAAIGRVESNHGRYGGNTLDSDGVSRPGIYGIPLDGSHHTSKISDTDAGQYDHDPAYDRAVGPMQFIPSTWSVIGVDGDNDGKRNPQDIDDAALATAVYLCSGNEDLSGAAGQRVRGLPLQPQQRLRGPGALDRPGLRPAATSPPCRPAPPGPPPSRPATAARCPPRAPAAATLAKRAHAGQGGSRTGGGSSSSGSSGSSSGGPSAAGTPSAPSTEHRAEPPRHLRRRGSGSGSGSTATKVTDPVKKVVKKVVTAAPTPTPAAPVTKVDRPGAQLRRTPRPSAWPAGSACWTPTKLNACIANLTH